MREELSCACGDGEKLLQPDREEAYHVAKEKKEALRVTVLEQISKGAAHILQFPPCRFSGIAMVSAPSSGNVA